MKKSINLSIMLILLLTLGAIGVFGATTGDLRLIDEITSLNANVSSSVTGSFKLNNTGSANLTGITLSASLFENANYNISSAQVSFAPNNFRATLLTTETPEYNYTISVPSAAYSGVYTGEISAKDTTNSHTDSFTVTLTVNPSPSLTADNPSVTVVQGEQASVNMTFTNTGNTDVTAAVDRSDAVGSSSDIDKNNILIEQPGVVEYAKNKKVSVTVNVPSTQSAGNYNSVLTVTYGSLTFNKTLTVVVVAKSEDLTVSSPSYTWARSLSVSESQKIKVKNTGNVDMSSVALSVTDLTYGSTTIDSSKVSFSANNFALAKGAEKEVTVTVSNLLSDIAVGTYSGSIKADYGTGNKTASISVLVREPQKQLSVPSSVELGSTSEKRNQNFTKSFNINNSGDYDLTNVVVTSTATDKHEVKFSLDNVNYQSSLNLGTVAKSTGKTIYVKTFAPVSMDTGSVDIGDIKFTADDYTVSISKFEITTKSFLDINDAKIYYGDEDDSLDNGDLIEDVRPGDKIKIEVEVENLFDDDIEEEEDMDMDSIEVTIESDEDVGDDEVDESSSVDKLKPGKKDSTTIEFEIPEDADEGTYDFTLTVEGEDDEDSNHKLVWSFQLKVEKEDHDLDIVRAELSDSTLSCNKDTYLNIFVRNLGQDDEDEVRVKITSTDLDITSDFRDIELTTDVGDDDNEWTYSLPIRLKDSVETGTYKIKVETFYDDTKRSNSEEVELKVEECTSKSSSSSSSSSSTSKTQPSSGKSNDETGSIVVQTPTGSSGVSGSQVSTSSSNMPPVSITETTSASFRDSNIYVVLLLAAVIVVGVAITTLLVKGFGPKYRY